ncbi:putative ABC transport system permease protein [Pedobacter cryoconitis]|uniref:Putative ABC transport system permease protein n=1 Tax=Pedobacter cryoconitis TaxID=188932 RepID=A0A7W8ZR37_9SPHI|nr:ABC transporter permease [Pedobacter cryoconitis]MBB5638651.1 putative ABC transport system permease protein [Pedobacter cryoconitis]
MLKNYFKIAIAVLKRRKFFTFISLFGISFTLTILMVTTAFLDKIFSPNYPDLKRNRSLYVTTVLLKNSKEGWMNRSPASFYLLDKYISTLKVPAKIAISSFSAATNTYVNNKKIIIEFKYTNADFWDILDYQFLEGKPFNKKQIDQAAHVAVISEDTKKAYFGDAATVIGKSIEADNVNYKVIGVVKNVPRTMTNIYGDMYLPYTVSKANYKEPGLMGDYNAILLAGSDADVPKMKQEFNQMIAKVPINNKEFDQFYCSADGYFEGIAREIAGRDDGSSGVVKLISILSLLAFLFLLLPTINLVNINMTRIMERSSEIGVRKAFGASSRTLVYQFIVENIILTFIGGAIGIILSVIVIYYLNTLNLVPNLNLSLNLAVLGYTLIACLFFGLLSGVYPAWRMSRLNVVTALKAN